MKVYTSFEELDRDIEILRLEKDIAREEIKMQFHEAKDNLSFLGIVGNSAGYILKRILALKVINKFFR